MSGWMCRAPNEMTGSGAAASTHSRAAVAQPVDWASIPRIAVSYSPNCAIARADPQHDLLGRDPVAVGERLELRLARVRRGEHVAEQVLRLVDPAQDGLAAGEDLHRHDRVEALALEDLVGPREVDVGRVAGQDLVRRAGSLEAHRSGSTPAAGRLAGRHRRRARSPDRRGGECRRCVCQPCPTAARPRPTAPAVAADASRRHPDPRRRRRRIALTSTRIPIRAARMSSPMLIARPCPIDRGGGPHGGRVVGGSRGGLEVARRECVARPGEVGLGVSSPQTERQDRRHLGRPKGHGVGVAVDDLELDGGLGPCVVEPVVVLERESQRVRGDEPGGLGGRGHRGPGVERGLRRSSSSAVASSNRQARIASRTGSRHAPVAGVRHVSANRLAGGCSRVEERDIGRSGDPLRHRSSYVASVRSSSRSSRPRQSGGPSTVVGRDRRSAGSARPGAASAHTARRPSSPARSAIALARASEAAYA